MNRLKLLYVLLLVVIAESGIAQQPERGQVGEYQVLSRETISGNSGPGGPSEPLLNHKHQIVGSYFLRQDGSTFRYETNTQDGKSASIEALSYVFYNENADRLITFGNPVFQHVVSEAQVKLYSGNGQLIRDLGTVAVFPFKLAMSEDGAFYVAGKSSWDAPEFHLKKYSKEGNLEWSRSIPEAVPSGLSVSGNGQAVGVALYDEKSLRTQIRCYSSSGQLAGENADFNLVSSINFLDGDKVIICTGRQIYIYPSSFQSLLSQIRLPGNVIGEFSIGVSPSGSKFSVVSIADPDTQGGYRIQTFDTGGSLINEITLSKQPVWQPYHFVKFHSEDEFSVTVGYESLRLKINQ